MINLKKGQPINLKKELNVSDFRVGLCWDPADEYSPKADLDLSFVVLRNGKFIQDEDLVFYNNKFGVNGIVGSIDNRTGEGDADDEIGTVNVDKLDSNIDKIIVTASIYEADLRQQTFASIKNAYIYLADNKTGNKLCEYKLTKDASEFTIIEFAEIYKDENGHWNFKTGEDGFTTDTQDGKVVAANQITVINKYI